MNMCGPQLMSRNNACHSMWVTNSSSSKITGCADFQNGSAFDCLFVHDVVASDIQDIEIDGELRPHEVMVKVVATGLCHTDLAVRARHLPVPLPAVLGHEGAGIVESTGSGVTKAMVRDRVVMAPSSCGKCSYCLSGHPSYGIYPAH